MSKKLRRVVAFVLSAAMIAGVLPAFPHNGTTAASAQDVVSSFGGCETFEAAGKVPSFVTVDGNADVVSFNSASVLRINGAAGHTEASVDVSALTAPHVSLIAAFSNPGAEYGISLGDLTLNAKNGALYHGSTALVSNIEKDVFYKIDIYTDESDSAKLYVNDTKLASVSFSGKGSVVMSAKGGYLYIDCIGVSETPLKYFSGNTSDITANGGSKAFVAGTGGKPAYDKSVFVTSTSATTESTNVYYRCSSFEISDNGIYSIEANILPVNNVSSIFFATQSHASISDYITGFTAGVWNKVQCIVDTGSGTWSAYLNGKNISSGLIPERAMGYIDGKTNEFRIVAVKASTTAAEVETIYFDDMSVCRLDSGVGDAAVYEPQGTGSYLVEDGIITGSVTLGGLAAQAGTNVRTYAYADESFTPLNIDRNTLLSDGNIVVFANEDNVYSYWKISSDTPIAELSSGFVKNNFVNSSSLESVAGFGGKAANDESAHVYGACIDNNTYYSSGTLTYDSMSTYTLEASFYPVSGVSKIFVGTRSHARLSNEIYPGDFILNQWNRIHFVYFPQTGKSASYLNGTFRGYYDLSDTAKGYMDAGAEIRFIAYQQSSAGVDIYFDDIKVTSTVGMPVYSPFELDTAGSSLACADDSVIYINGDVTAADLDSELGAANNCTISAVDASDNCIDGVISEGDTVACESHDGIFAYYTAKIWSDREIIYDGDNILAKAADGAMLMSARYNSDGSLADLDIARDGDDGIYSLTCVPGDEDKLKIMLWDGRYNLKALEVNTAYAGAPEAKPSVLFVGSEHSLDMSAYLKSAAASAGLDFGVGVLMSDDADFASQYASASDSSYNEFVYDGKNIGNFSFDEIAASSEYRWDYVVLESSVESYYTSISDTYETDIISIVDYVNQKIPDSSIAIVQPLTCQVGYHYDGTVVTASSYAEMTDWLYNSTKSAVLSAIYKIGRNVIFVPAGSVLKSAGDMSRFNTTYDKAAHEALTDNTYVGAGIISDGDSGDIALYRDGIHASPAGRFVLANVLLKSITGYSSGVAGFNSDVRHELECDRYDGSDAITCIFGYIDTDDAGKLINNTTKFFDGNINISETDGKNDGFRTKSDAETAMLESFDEYSGEEIGNGWVISSNGNTFSAEPDKANGGNYLEFSKTSTSTKLEATKYFDPVGGSLRVDFQLSLFDIASYMTMALYSFNYSDDANDITTLTLNNGTLVANTTEVAALEANTWYDISMYFYADTYTYNVYVNGELEAENIPYSMNIRTLSAFKLVSPANYAADMGIDNIRVSFITDTEYNSTYAPEEESSVLIDEDFESTGAYGSYTSGTSITDSSNKTAGDITYQHDGSNGYIQATRTASSGTCSVLIPFKKTSQDVVAEFKIKLLDNNSSTKLITLYVSGYAFTFYFGKGNIGSNLITYENDGADGRTSTARKKYIMSNRWYDVKLETNTAKRTYNLTWNGSDVYSDIPYETVSSLNQLRFAITSSSDGVTAAYALDDLVINEIPVQYDGYNPDETGAPEMYSWQDTYMSDPSGIVVNAEDMNLDNCTVSDDAVFHGSKGATVSDWGVGSAKFAFNGETGYYAINVGYRESEGMYDSSYELNHNGRRIDWWLGQYDDGQRHVRKSKTWHYIENGDEFEIVGSYGKDPASVDYVEFTKSDIPEFTFGDLIDDAASAHPSYWLDSSWVGEEEGGYVRNGHTIHDARTDAKSAAVRNFYPTAKSLSLDFTFKASLKTPFVMTVGDGFKDALSVSFSNGIVLANGVTTNTVYGTSSNLARLVVDRESDTFSLYIKSAAVLENIPLASGMDKLSVLKFSTTDSGTGTLTLSNLRMNAGYVLDEAFRAMTAGSTPEFAGWEISDATVASMSSENADANSLKISAGGTASKSISTDSKVITFETNFILPAKKDGAKISIGSDSGCIGLYTSGDDIYYDNGDGDTSNDEIVWSGYLHNIWYSASVVADLENKTASFAINDFSKKDNIGISISEINKISYEAGSAEGELWIDDIKVIGGTYACEVPEPQPAQTDYTIVMEACDLWREGHHFGSDSLIPFDNRTPFLGYLEDGNPEVADWETKFLIEHGINTYATCWYVNANWNCSPVKTPRNSAKLNVGYMKSKYVDMLDFAIIVTVVGGNYGADPFLEHQVRYWIERYFRSPNYWKVDNKPVIPIYDINSVNNIDSMILYKIEALLKKHGFDGAIFLGTHNNNVTTTTNGYDYKYQYHQSNTNIVGHNVIQSLSSKQSTDGVKMLASPSQGWGNEAWGRADRKINMPLDEWQASLEWIRDVYMLQEKAADSTSLSGNTLWLGNWNEYSEGHFLAPSNISGFGYVDAVRKVFTTAAEEHEDVVPSKQFDWLTSFKYR